MDKLHQPLAKPEDDDDDHGHEGEELEALSLCDLPVGTIEGEYSKPTAENEGNEHEDDFEFGSVLVAGHGGLIKAFNAEMCVADDIFFAGQILPLRHSISSDGREYSRGILSRSESMDHGWISSGYTSSSRSSSNGSRYSSSIASNTIISSGSGSSSGKIRNPFHSFPSPSPQIRAAPGTRSVPNCSPAKKSSTVWEFLRLGLVRAPPEIGLQDLKARRSTGYRNDPIISRTSSSSSTTTNNGTSRAKGTDNCSRPSIHLKHPKKKQPPPTPPPPSLPPVADKRFSNRNGGGGVFGGCTFSVWAVEPVPSSTRGGDVKRKDCGGTATAATGASAERGTKWKRQEQRRQTKGVVSSHRTFEWLKELSHVGVLNPV
ncbi:hypothetical protein Dimus_017216 [Dionaea muscipula]